MMISKINITNKSSSNDDLKAIIKFDSIKTDISDFKIKDIYDEDIIKEIDINLESISNILSSKDPKNKKDIKIEQIQQKLFQNLQKHKLLDLFLPYEQIFKNHVIKLRSFPISILNMVDSEIILGFYQQLQSALLYMKNLEKTVYGFNIFIALNSTKDKFSNIILKLIDNENVSYDYYIFLNQVSESLINFQNILDLALKIQKICTFLSGEK